MEEVNLEVVDWVWVMVVVDWVWVMVVVDWVVD
jgi:hypothetical protein